MKKIIWTNLFLVVILSLVIFAAPTDYLIVNTVPEISIPLQSKHTLNLVPYIYTDYNIDKLHVKIEPNPHISASGKLNSIEISSNNDYIGLTNLTLTLFYGKETVKTLDIPVKVIQNRFEVNVEYKRRNDEKRVAIAGSMNGWNADANVLEFDSASNTFKTTLHLAPGMYFYKLVIDGDWIPDPDNDNKTGDGFGGFNSVLEISDPSEKYKPDFYKFDKIESDNLLKLGYYINRGSISLDKNKIYLNNEKLTFEEEYDVYIDENVLTLVLKLNELDFKELNTFRFYFYDRENHVFSNQKIFDYHCEDYFDYKDAVIYYAFVDRFYDGDPDNNDPIIHDELHEIANYMGGDLRGIITKMEEGYFCELGINAIWLSPLYKNPDIAYKEFIEPYNYFTGYHGYWPVDNYTVEPRWGTMDILRELVETSHERGIKILLDCVANHVHTDNPVYEENKDWFGQMYTPDGERNLRLFDRYPETTWFDSFLPSFDFASDDAIDWVADNAIWWLKESGADGFRQDAVKHIPHRFWVRFRERLKAEFEHTPAQRIWMVGETIDSREKILEYISEEELDAQFDFPLYWTLRETFAAHTKSFIDMQQELKLNIREYGTAMVSSFAGNHDFPRFMSYADGAFAPGSPDEKRRAFEDPPQLQNPTNLYKIGQAISFVMTLNGPPLLYYGDEIGLMGAHDPDNRRMMRFQDDWIPEEKELFNLVSTVIHTRHKHPAMRYGKFIPLYVSEDVWVFMRNYFNDNVIVAFNRSQTETTVELDLPSFIVDKTFVSVLSENTLDFIEGNTITVAPLSTNVYVAE